MRLDAMDPSSTTNEEVCNYHFLNDVNGENESGILTSPPSTATLQDAMKDLKIKQEIKELKSETQPQETKVLSITDRTDELITILLRKDSTIKRMSSEFQLLEAQLQSAVNGKMDAISRLQKIEGKEQKLLFKERQMDSEVERLNSDIKGLTENLNKKVVELTVTRGELVSVSAQSEIDIKDKSEQLRIANANIVELSQTNEMLKEQNKDYANKLDGQFNESDKLMQIYEEKLKAQTKLAELYKGNSDDYQAQVEELSAGTAELKRLLYETVDQCGIFETELKQSDLDRQTEYDAQNEVINKLKQELKDANSLLKAYQANDGDDPEIDGEEIGFEIANNLPLSFTQLYSQYRDVANKLESKEREYNFLELEMKELLREVKEKAFQFEEQQIEWEKCKEANKKLIEDRNNFRVESIFGREELKSCRLQCELLKNENDKLKFFGLEYLKPHHTDDHLNAKLDFSIAGGKSNAELEHQNQKLLVIVRDLMTRLNGIEENMDCEMKTDENVVTSGISACDKSVEVTENDFLVEDDRHSSSNEIIVRMMSAKEDDSTKIEKLTHDNWQMQNKIRELAAERDLLVAEKNLFDVRYNQRKEQIESLDKENQKYVDIISEYAITNRYLRDENANATMKLFTAEDRLTHLQNQHRTLTDIKDSFVVEVATLKQELFEEKVSNKTLRHELEMMNGEAERMKIEQKMSSQTEVDHRQSCCEDTPNKIFSDEAIQTDNWIENPKQITSEINVVSNETVIDDFTQAKKSDFLNSLKLTEACQSDSPKKKLNSQKRNVEDDDGVNTSANSSVPNVRSMQLRSKKARVSFVDLSEESDEEAIIDVCNIDSSPEQPDIQMQYLSEVRTRKQARFIQDIFSSCDDPVSRAIVKPVKSNEEKVLIRKRTRGSFRDRGRSTRCRSSGGGTSEIAKPSSRSQSADHHQSPTIRRSNRNRSSSSGRSTGIVEQSNRSGSIGHYQSIPGHPKLTVGNVQLPVDQDSAQQVTANHLEIYSSNRRSNRLVSRFRRLAQSKNK